LKKLLIVVLGTVVSFIIPLFYSFGLALGRDWGYFNSLSLVVRSNILSYGRFPIHDPWVLGGIDLLANPQTRIFSPLVLLDILFLPRWGNLLGLMLYAGLGFWGMFLLLKEFEVSDWAAMAGAFIFINGSWFGLHFAEGHITFGSFQLFPWVLFFAFKIWEKKFQLFLVLLLAFFILDGGFYTFLYSLILAGIAPILKPQILKKIKWDPFYLLILFFTFLCITSVKLVPFFLFITPRAAGMGNVSLPWDLAVYAFFNPIQTLLSIPLGRVPYGYFLDGCYLGVVSLLVIGIQLASPGFFKKNRILIMLTLIFLWIGTGWGYPLNPWVLYSKIPLLNNLHIQSRFFILMYFFLIILLARALNQFKNRKIFWLAITWLVLESVMVKNIPFWAAFKTLSQVPQTNKLIQTQTITTTKKDGPKPHHYFKGHGSLQTYEPAPYPSYVLSEEDPKYQGEIYFVAGQGKAQINSFTPGRIEFQYKSNGPAVIELNTNALLKWEVTQGKAQVIRKKTGRLAAQISPNANIGGWAFLCE